MSCCLLRKETQSAAEPPEIQAVIPLPNIDSLRLKRQAKRNRFTRHAAVTGCQSNSKGSWSPSPGRERLDNRSREVHLRAADARPSAFDEGSIDYSGFSEGLAFFIRRVFPTGMMVAALLFVLNTLILINLPSPELSELSGSAGGLLMELGVIVPSAYLIVGMATRFMINKRNVTGRASFEAAPVRSTTGRK